MKTVKLDANGDIDLSTGNIQLISGAEYVKQKIRTRLMFLKEEWFLDSRLGFPWFQEILGHKPVPGLMERLIREMLLGIIGVKEITRLTHQFDSATREGRVDWTVRTEEGEVISGGTPFIL